MSEIVDLNDIASKDFPAVSQNVLKTSKGGDLSGFNPAIHESPPRRTKNGAWALKRGNKRGFVVGKKKSEQQAAAAQNETQTENETINQTANEPPPPSPEPPLNIPPAPEEQAAEQAAQMEQEQAAADLNKYSAKIVAGTITGLGAALSGYQCDAAFQTEYEKAFENWFVEMGGVQVRAWVQVALLSGLYGMNVVRARKKESALERFKNWLVVKYYNFRNRKNKNHVELDHNRKENPQKSANSGSGAPSSRQ